MPKSRTFYGMNQTGGADQIRGPTLPRFGDVLVGDLLSPSLHPRLHCTHSEIRFQASTSAATAPGAAAGRRSTCGLSGRAADRRRNQCRRTAAAPPEPRRAQPSSACRTPGMPSGRDPTPPSHFPCDASLLLPISRSQDPAENCTPVPALLDSESLGYSTLGSDVSFGLQY